MSKSQISDHYKNKPCDLRNRVFCLFRIILHLRIFSLFTFSLFPCSSDICINRRSNSQFRRPLAYLRQISTRVSMSVLRQKGEINFGSHRRLLKASFEDRQPRYFVWQRNIDKLIKTTRTEEGGVNLVRSVG